MSGYTIEMVRTAGLTDAERKRRLAQAFDVLLAFPVSETADLGELGGHTQDGGSNPDPSQGRDART